MTLNLKKKVALTASQMLAENNRATADRLTWAAQTDEMNLRTALNVPENGLTEEMAEEARDRYGRNVLPTSQRTPLYKRLAAAFINPFTVVLVLLAIFSALTNVAMVDPGDGHYHHHHGADFRHSPLRAGDPQRQCRGEALRDDSHDSLRDARG